MKPNLNPSYEDEELSQLQRRHPEYTDALNGSRLLHGAKSASLLAFTEYNHYSGQLIPLGMMERNGRVPFCGEIIFGRKSVNDCGISTTHILDPFTPAQYSGLYYPRHQQVPTEEDLLKHWHEEANRRIEEEYKKHGKEASEEFKKNLLEVLEKRLSHWQRLNQIEKLLVIKNFPVLYGIQLNGYRLEGSPAELGENGHQKNNRIEPGKSSIPSEIIVNGRINPDEIKVVWVPSSEISLVQSLFRPEKFRHILVEPAEIFLQFAVNRNLA